MENFEEKIYPESEEELEKAKEEVGVEKAPKTPEEVKLRFQRKIEEEMKKPNPDKELIEKYQQFVENPDLYFQDEMLIAMKERARQELLPSLIDKVITELTKSKKFEGNEEDLRNLLQEGLEISFEAICRNVFSDKNISTPKKWESLKLYLDFKTGWHVTNADEVDFIVKFLQGDISHRFTPWYGRRSIEKDFRSEKQRLLDFLGKARKEFLPKILIENEIEEVDDFMHKVGFFWDGEEYRDTKQYWNGSEWQKVPDDPRKII